MDHARLRPAPRTARGLCTLCAALLLLSGCRPSAGATGSTPATVERTITVPVTVEVTREVISERIVTATPQPAAPCLQPPLAQAQEVVIGAILPLSQVASMQGSLAVQVALNLAAGQINAAGGIDGRPLRIWYADAGSDPGRAAAAAQQAISEQCAVALLATQTSESVQAIAAAAQASRTPVLVLEAAENALTEARLPHLFRLAPANAMLAGMYADWLTTVGDYNGDGTRQALIVAEQSESGLAYAEMIAAALREQAFSADIFDVDLPRADFSSLIARIVVRETAPDAILIRFNGESAADFQRQLIENGIGPARQTLLVATRQALMQDSFWPLVGESGNYTVVGRAGPWHSTATARGADFAAAFDAWLKRWPDTAAFLAYDAVYLLSDAILRTATLAGSDMVTALEDTNMDGAVGHYSFPVNSRTAAAGAAAAGEAAWSWHQWLQPPLIFLQYTAVGQPAAEMTVIWPPELAGRAGPVVRPPSP